MNKTEICNLALTRIGVSRTIDSIDEGSVEASTCKTVFDSVVNSTFRKDYFPALKEYRALSLVAESPNDNWGYAYQYPVDCIRFRRIVCGNRYTQGRMNIEFERGIHEGNSVIFTDADEAVAEIQAYPTTFTDDIGSMLAWKLGAEIVAPLAVDMARRNDCLQMFQLEKSEVLATQLNESYDEPVESEFINVRGLD